MDKRVVTMLAQISSLSGILVIVSLLLTMFAAVSMSSHDFSPFDYWIEDYGIASENPHGAVYYDTGFMVTGTFLIVFSLGISIWHTSKNKLLQVLLLTGQSCGTMAGIVLILKGYTLLFDYMKPLFWSISFFLLVAIAITLITCFMVLSRGHDEATICVGFASVSLIGLLAVTLYFNVAPVITEWLAAAFMLVWVALASRDLYRHSLSYGMIKPG